MKFPHRLASVVLIAAIAPAALAQMVSVTDAWVRTAVPGQHSTAAFMTITARENTRLVAVASPVAGVAEVHAMRMVGGVMTMRALEGGLELPAGRTVELKSGGQHVMLMDLKAALPIGGSVPMTLVFRNAKGIQSQIELSLPVALVAQGMHKH